MAWTYEKAWQRLTTAYVEDKVEPYKSCACFVGNLLKGNQMWVVDRYITGLGTNLVECGFHSDSQYALSIRSAIRGSCEGYYTPKDILKLESCFMNVINDHPEAHPTPSNWKVVTEDSLFRAFEKTLELLKAIHEDKGEIIEDFVFTKRKLKTNELELQESI